MKKDLLSFLDKESTHLQQAGLFRNELTIGTPQQETITVGKTKLVNMGSSNYLGFANHPAVREAAKAAIDEFGVGVASQRLLAGTQVIHGRLERAVAGFLNAEEAMVFPSAYHVRTGLFEPLYNERDYVFCDALCHPSLADGIRLCRARVLLYRHHDLTHLEDRLKRSRAARFRVIVTDGVFSMDGSSARLAEICALADKYGAQVFVDDAQGIGVLGAKGRGAVEACGVGRRVDVISGSFSHALGGGAGGFVAGRRQIIAWLRQKSRPYLVSGALDPGNAGAALKALEILEQDPEPLARLRSNATWFRESLSQSGFSFAESEHPIIGVMVGDAMRAQRMVDKLLHRSIYTVGFCYPVVPEGEARVRVQVTAGHSEQGLRRAARAFENVGKELGLCAG